MKKIWPWLLLLLLLIILCTCTHKDTLLVTSHHTKASKQSPKHAGVALHSTEVDYVIEQTGKKYTLSGNLKEMSQQRLLEQAFATSNKKLSIGIISTNVTLEGEESILLTKKILPLFMEKYDEGKIQYKENQLTVEGQVEEYASKDEMQRLLNLSTMLTQNNTDVVLAKPISFHMQKHNNRVSLDGTFTNMQQSSSLKQLLNPNDITNIMHNQRTTDKKAVVPFMKKFIPFFKSYYTQGGITYNNELLTVQGKVKDPLMLSHVNRQLSSTTIKIKNLTTLDEKVYALAQKAKREKLAKEQKAKEEAERKKLADEKAKETQNKNTETEQTKKP